MRCEPTSAGKPACGRSSPVRAGVQAAQRDTRHAAAGPDGDRSEGEARFGHLRNPEGDAVPDRAGQGDAGRAPRLAPSAEGGETPAGPAVFRTILDVSFRWAKDSGVTNGWPGCLLGKDV